MASWLPKVRVAACNVSPVFLDTAKTVQKTTSLIREAANNRADLVVFPETYIPAYPLWAAVAAPIDNHSFFTRLAQESLLIDGEEVRTLRQACAQNRIFAHIGFNERSHASLGCIWNSSILVSDEGKILNHARKLVPTFSEKLVWAMGDAVCTFSNDHEMTADIFMLSTSHGLKVVDTERCGKVGSLICGENTNPLARFSLIAQGEQLHITTWPAVYPTKRVSEDAGAADKSSSSDKRQYDNVAANRIRTAAHCFEAKCFSVLCSGFMDKEMRDAIVNQHPAAAKTLDTATQGASLFLDPTGTQVGDQVQGEEGIAYGDLDLNACVEPKQIHDVVGSYQRFDIFDLKVNRRRLGPSSAQETELDTGVSDLRSSSGEGVEGEALRSRT